MSQPIAVAQVISFLPLSSEELDNSSPDFDLSWISVEETTVVVWVRLQGAELAGIVYPTYPQSFFLYELTGPKIGAIVDQSDCHVVHVDERENSLLWGPLRLDFQPLIFFPFVDAIRNVTNIHVDYEEPSINCTPPDADPSLIVFDENVQHASQADSVCMYPSKSSQTKGADPRSRRGVHFNESSEVHLIDSRAPISFHMSQEGEYDPASLVGLTLQSCSPIAFNGNYKTRHGHTVNFLPGYGFVVVGGGLNDSISGDILLIRPDLSVSTLGQLKRPRRAHATLFVDDKLIMYAGGHTYNASLDMYYDDVVVMDFNTKKQFELPAPKSYCPPARRQHSFVRVGDNAILFGGSTKKSRRNDVVAFNFEEVIWRPIWCAGSIPCGRSYHAADALSSHHMVVYGGMDSSGAVLGDCYVLFVDANTLQGSWIQIEVEGGDLVPLMNHTLNCYEGYAIICGGYDRNRCYADVWILDFRELLSTEHTVEDCIDVSFRVPCCHYELQSSTPVMEARFAHASCMVENQLYVFGGRNLQSCFGDIWKFEFQHQ